MSPGNLAALREQLAAIRRYAAQLRLLALADLTPGAALGGRRDTELLLMLATEAIAKTANEIGMEAGAEPADSSREAVERLAACKVLEPSLAQRLGEAVSPRDRLGYSYSRMDELRIRGAATAMASMARDYVSATREWLSHREGLE